MEARLGSEMAFQVSATIILQRNAALDKVTALLSGQVHACCLTVPGTDGIARSIDDPCKGVSNETVTISTTCMDPIIAGSDSYEIIVGLHVHVCGKGGNTA